MAEKSSKTNHAPKSIDTLVGAGVRIEGDIACPGVLRVQGDILGNVSCRDNAGSTLVVDGAGCVTGSVDAAHVAVRGRIVGPVHSSQSIEIHQGACVVGDISFRGIAIHAGGIVEGLLHPATAEPAAADPPPPAAKSRGIKAHAGVRRVGAAVLLLIAVAAAAWMANNPGTPSRPVDESALRADSTLKAAAEPSSPAAAGGGNPQGTIAAADGDAASPAPSLPAGAQDVAAAPSPPDRAVQDRDKVATVKGINPNRPAGVFLLVSNEPSVLFRKKRDDTAEGTRIAVAEGEKVSVAIAPDELIRVAQGRDIVLLYQGKKVPRNIIESGAWISFVPR